MPENSKLYLSVEFIRKDYERGKKKYTTESNEDQL